MPGPAVQDQVPGATSGEMALPVSAGRARERAGPGWRPGHRTLWWGGLLRRTPPPLEPPTPLSTPLPNSPSNDGGRDRFSTAAALGDVEFPPCSPPGRDRGSLGLCRPAAKPCVAEHRDCSRQQFRAVWSHEPHVLAGRPLGPPVPLCQMFPNPFSAACHDPAPPPGLLTAGCTGSVSPIDGQVIRRQADPRLVVLDDLSTLPSSPRGSRRWRGGRQRDPRPRPAPVLDFDSVGG